MEKVRELTKALERALEEQKNRFQSFSENWKILSQEKNPKKIRDFYHDLLDFHYDVYYAYGGKGTIQVTDGPILLGQVDDLVDQVITFLKQELE